MGRPISNKNGEQNKNNIGLKMTIISYINNNNIFVEFDDYKESVHTTYSNFIKGNVKSKMYPCICKKGYLGIGDYMSKINNKNTIQYEYWKSMLKRCYDEKYLEKEPTYIGCEVCESWHNFQNFAKWFDNNYYEIDNEKIMLDKDILVKGNKIYSPDTCIFVPQRINSLFITHKSRRGNLPIGVNFHNQNNKYVAKCNVIKLKKRKTIYLGYYFTPENAFYNGYKPYKEKYIKQVANEYKDKIPELLYNAMYNWVININD